MQREKRIPSSATWLSPGLKNKIQSDGKPPNINLYHMLTQAYTHKPEMNTECQ